MLELLFSLLSKGNSNYNNNSGWNNSNGFTNPEFVDIQLQDNTGNWRTYQTTQNNSQMIASGMRNLASNYSGSRVRAVDTNGRLIDIL